VAASRARVEDLPSIRHRLGLGRAGVLAVAALVGLAACAGGTSTSRASPLPSGAQARDPTLLAGRKVYVAECATCHGSRGQGGVGPTFHDGRLRRDFPSPSDQVAFVSKGKGVMPPFAGVLTSRQLGAVVAYERQVLSTAR
jgi:mono/diheme cytochrome c family protein